MKRSKQILLSVFLACFALLLFVCSGARGAETETMRIRFSFKGGSAVAALLDNPPARYFHSSLPLELTLRDYKRTEKIADLPRKLSSDGAPAGHDPKVGDLTLYVP